MPVRFRKAPKDRLDVTAAVALRLSIGGAQIRVPHQKAWGPLMKPEDVFSRIEQEIRQYPHMTEVLVIDEEARWPRNWPRLQD
jgi:hypothetical protein